MSGPPRQCAFCGNRPVLRKTVRYCHDCHPGGPIHPPPCRKCGSERNYYSAGLCSRCHQYAPQPLDACLDCHAWGVQRTHGWLCRPCLHWRRAPLHQGCCAACGELRALRQGSFCRLCWRTASTFHVANRYDDGGRYQPIDIVAANAHGQQLFLANQPGWRNRHKPKPHPSSDANATTPQTARPTYFQPMLWDNRPDSWARRHNIPLPRSNAHAEALKALAADLAAQRGWSDSSVKRLDLGIEAVLGWQASADSPVPASHVSRVTELGVHCARLLREVLTEAGLFIDDQPAVIERWLHRTIDGLPAPMTDELTTWYSVLRHGSSAAPRSRPRRDDTIRLRISYAMPVVRRWAMAGHDSLREISRADVVAALPASGNERVLAGIALRSLFRTLKAHGVVFTNPAARIKTGTAEATQPLPVDPGLLRAALLSEDPAVRAITALLAFHGLRPGELRRLQRTDLHDRRLHLGDRVIPVADPVHERLNSYLEHRARRWPRSINPHLFINKDTAGHTTAVGELWIGRRLGITGRQLRDDRILDEVHATGGDIRRLTDLFNLSTKAACRYLGLLSHPALEQ